MYSIFEDLAPTIHTQLQALADNIFVHSVWPLEAKCDLTQESEQIYRAKSLADTFNPIVNLAAAYMEERLYV
jgi:hypothetical protein